MTIADVIEKINRIEFLANRHNSYKLNDDEISELIELIKEYEDVLKSMKVRQ